MEQGGAAVATFRDWIVRCGYVGPDVRLPRSNESVGGGWRSYYDDATATIVAGAYAEDFRRFGYDPEGWRGGSVPPTETDGERRWRREVVKRNAMIARLYDELDSD
jgi:hypothetical protein